jgi:hypothetical protein
MRPRLQLLALCCGFSAAVAAQTCDCPPAFNFVREKIEKNYAGFSEKVKAQNCADYDAHSAAFQARADTCRSVRNCAKTCLEWLQWFNDKHLYVGPGGEPPRRPDSDFALTALDSHTLLLRLPSMGDRYRPLIDKVLSENKALLERHPHLIVDCRGNRGGSLGAWIGLKPYLFSGPVVTDGYLFWASADNAAMLEAGIGRASSKAHKKYLKKTAKEMRKSPGRFVGTMNARRESPEAVLPNPQKVVILADKACASSCEEFLLWARQSKKVTLMGEQTAGVSDFGAITYDQVPCHNWVVAYPTARSNRVADGRGIDNIGIPPQVKLDDTTPDWVEFARQFFD